MNQHEFLMKPDSAVGRRFGARASEGAIHDLSASDHGGEREVEANSSPGGSPESELPEAEERPGLQGRWLGCPDFARDRPAAEADDPSPGSPHDDPEGGR